LNEIEREVRRRYEEQGYDVIHVGVPDFILLKDGQIEFIEVKYSADGFRESQQRAFSLLRKHGFKVTVERIPEVYPSPLFKEFSEKVKLDEMRAYP